MRKALRISLVTVTPFLAVVLGYHGLALRSHVRPAAAIAFTTIVSLAVLSLSRVFREHYTTTVRLALVVGVFCPILSMAVGHVAFRYRIREAERFFEAYLPFIEASHHRTGTYPREVHFPCTSVPSILEAKCQDGFISGAYERIPPSRIWAAPGTAPPTEDVYSVSFYPPHEELWEAYETWWARTYSSRFRRWSWAIVD
jgi:hypothetical protein